MLGVAGAHAVALTLAWSAAAAVGRATGTELAALCALPIFVCAVLVATGHLAARASRRLPPAYGWTARCSLGADVRASSGLARRGLERAPAIAWHAVEALRGLVAELAFGLTVLVGLLAGTLATIALARLATRTLGSPAGGAIVIAIALGAAPPVLERLNARLTALMPVGAEDRSPYLVERAERELRPPRAGASRSPARRRRRRARGSPS